MIVSSKHPKQTKSLSPVPQRKGLKSLHCLRQINPVVNGAHTLAKSSKGAPRAFGTPWPHSLYPTERSVGTAQGSEDSTLAKFSHMQ